MASNRISYACRRYFRLNELRNGWQQLRQESLNLNACRRYYRRVAVPFFAGNATLAFSIPGLSWGSGSKEKKEEKKEAVKENSVLVEADRLYSNNEHEALYNYLLQFKDQDNDEILWRLARAACDFGKMSPDAKKKELYYEGFAYIKRALALNESNYAVHKWYAILLNYTCELEGYKPLIENSVKVKEHFMRAIELNPKDATSIHSLGVWCFTIASMRWYERKFASIVYATPPTSSYEEALKYFLLAEETEPNFYSKNLLMLGQTYMKLQNSEKAYEYLKRCSEHNAVTVDDKEAVDAAEHCLNMLGQRHRMQQEKRSKSTV